MLLHLLQNLMKPHKRIDIDKSALRYLCVCFSSSWPACITTSSQCDECERGVNVCVCVSPSADLHVLLHQERRSQRFLPVSRWSAHLLRVRLKAQTHPHAVSLRDSEFMKIVTCLFVCFSYSMIDRSLCRSYFSSLGTTDFSVLSSTLSFKKQTLFDNARDCLVIKTKSFMHSEKDLGFSWTFMYNYNSCAFIT